MERLPHTGSRLSPARTSDTIMTLLIGNVKRSEKNYAFVRHTVTEK